MNWGYKILIVYLAFVAGIVLMVFKSANQQVDLVTTDYYAKELKYQERIDAVKRTKALSTQVKYEVVNRKVVLSFPKEFSSVQIKGTVLLYCPSNQEKDIQQAFEVSNGSVIVDLPNRGTGSYELQVNWQANEKAYYFEDKIFL